MAGVAPTSGGIGGMTPVYSGLGSGASGGGVKLSPSLSPFLAMSSFRKALPAPAAGASVTDTGTGAYIGPGAARSFVGEPFAVWVGMLALLWLLGWFASKPDTLGGANPAFIKIGGYNFLAVGVTAAVFIVLLKVIANKTNFPGFVEFANAL